MTEKGEHKAKTEIAQKMLERGKTIEEITDLTGVSKKEIEALKKNDNS